MKKNNAKTSDKQMKKNESSDSAAASLRQTTLSESSNQGFLRSRLRPRKNAITYKDSPKISMLLEKNIPPEKRKSYVVLEKIDDSKVMKKPVYKTVKLGDESIKDKDGVYDFQFDINDPGEKSSKNKRKKKVTKKPAATKKKKTNPPSKNNVNEPPKVPEKSSEKDLIPPEDKEKPIDSQKPEQLHAKIENVENPKSEKLVIQKAPVISVQNLPPIVDIEEKNPRVKISSIETLTGDRKVSFKPNLSFSRQSSAKFNPFRSTQSIFKSRSTINKDMMEHSLLNKSLSPIKSHKELLDAASPWRPPLPDSFSSVKQVVQSTPQTKRNFGRATERLGFRIDENEIDENAEAKSTDAVKPSGAKPRNPLGVRISNAENIQASSSKTIEPVLMQETSPSVSKFESVRRPLALSSNYGQNKQNLGFGDRLYRSPKKNDKPTTSRGSLFFKKKSNPLPPRRGLLEELLPQKKDSVIYIDENSLPMQEPQFLQQSNLKTFSNHDETPENSTINTSHGIFGDGPSTPIIKPQTSKIQRKDDIDNCFGFDDDYSSDSQDSSIKLNKKHNTLAKRTFDRLKRRDLPNERQGTARISLGEIKNTLYARKETKFDKIKRIKDKNEKREADLGADKDSRKQKNEQKSKNTLTPLQFLDTFDVLSESNLGEGKDESMGNEIPLFTDLEPAHFTQPPRWSYTKKNKSTQYGSSGEDNDDEDIKQRHVPASKKRKLKRADIVKEKKINEWVENVNRTFQEIEDFDLIVEKLT